MTNKNAFTLIELQVGMLISTVLVLAIGGFAAMSGSAYNKLLNEGYIYNDLSYALKLMQKSVRESSRLPINNGNLSNPSDGQWVVNEPVLFIDIDGEEVAFGKLENTVQDNYEFVYLADRSKVQEREVLFTYTDDDKFDITMTVDPVDNAVEIGFSGNKNKVDYALSKTVKRRLQ